MFFRACGRTQQEVLFVHDGWYGELLWPCEIWKFITEPVTNGGAEPFVEFLGFDWRIQINNLSHFFLHTLCLWSAALGLKRISATCRNIKANGLTVFSIEEQALLVGMA